MSFYLSFRSRLLVGAACAAWLLAGCGGNVITPGNGGDGGGGGDGGDTGGPGGAGGSNYAGAKHAACAVASPSPFPPLPEINVTASGRPNFDLWRDVDCDAAAAYECGGDWCPNQAWCLDGVCTYGDSDLWCDGEGEVLSWGSGQCWMCAPIESHAAACCANMAGFDCRAWPYPSNGQAGTPCALHEDCQPGLVCGASQGAGYGICQCPGLDAESIHPEATCF